MLQTLLHTVTNNFSCIVLNIQQLEKYLKKVIYPEHHILCIAQISCYEKPFMINIQFELHDSWSYSGLIQTRINTPACIPNNKS
jgi:hypothetical protein